MEMKKVLTIAGSDSGGCAGIQADLKTMGALGVFGMSVITAVTSQNTLGVTYIEELSVKSVTTQMEAVYDDLYPNAVKTGMLFSKDIIEAVYNVLSKHNKSPYVLDPVMVATSGAKLLKDDAINYMIEKLFPIADLVTPNIPEAELISGISIKSQTDVDKACKIIKEKGAKNVIIKGGHFNNDESVDTLYDGINHYEIASTRIVTNNTHGTGCTYSSAISSYLALGYNMLDAVKYAKQYITSAIIYGAELKLGKGSGPVNHFYESIRNNNDGTISFGSCSCG